jgi:hypothetical protein
MSNIYQAMAEVMRDVEAIGKDKQNRQQGFKFRGIDDVYNAVHPIFAKHGVFTVPTVLSERTEERQTRSGGNLIYRILTMKYTFFASDGSSVEAVVIGEGMDSGDKGANKGMAVAHKYALLQTLCIPTEDMIDPDSEVHEPSTRKAIMTDATPIIPGLFTVRKAWNHILEICSGDKAFAKGLFEQFGAPTSKEITYEIYLDVLNAIKNPGGKTDGPELFEGDSLDNVPFEASGMAKGTPLQVEAPF